MKNIKKEDFFPNFFQVNYDEILHKYELFEVKIKFISGKTQLKKKNKNFRVCLNKTSAHLMRIWGR